MRHLAEALARDPGREDARALLDEVLTRASEPLGLFAAPGREPEHYKTLALYAYALARAGRYQEALDRLLRVASLAPGIPYLDWAREWLDEPAVAEGVDPIRFCEGLARWLGRYASPRPLSEHERRGLEHLAPVLERLLERHGEVFGLLILSASALRRVGRHRAALDCAERAYALQPGWHAATSVALVHREARRVDDAIAWYERALEHDPTDISARLDLGDLLRGQRRLEEAARYYAEVLEREPDHAWAVPSLLWVRWLQSEQREWLDRLVDLAGGHPPNERARDLLGELASASKAYAAYLPEPVEASVSFLRRMGPELPEGRRAVLTIRGFEGPSARRAVAMHLLRKGPRRFALELRTRALPSPDPRRPRGPVEYLLWEFEGLRPVAAVSPPPPGPCLEELLAIARAPYELEAWAEQGRALGERWGREALPVLLGSMAHPPEPPDDRDAWSWVRHVLFAAALALAYVDTGWRGSLRRLVLLSLARGPMDWSVEAAVVALAHLARSDPEIEQEVAGELIDMATSIPRPGRCCYEPAVLIQLLELPSLPPELREPLEAQLDALFED